MIEILVKVLSRIVKGTSIKDVGEKGEEAGERGVKDWLKFSDR